MGNGIPSKSAPNCSAVHPHVCGERFSSRCIRCRCCGSSPRLWGTDRVVITDATTQRFIPTSVGNGASHWAGFRRCTVHPHVCGERILLPPRQRRGYGSSPRLWGTADSVLDWFKRSAVHPHVCGERTKARRAAGRSYGSSPRLWGTVIPILPSLSDSRFIPTSVGNGPGCDYRRDNTTVHPHVCGER